MRNDTKIMGIFLGIIALILLFGLVSGRPQEQKTQSDSAVTMENATQIITLEVKGGYFPNVVDARAGIPTEIRFVTNDTFDCSLSVTVPKLNYARVLETTGSASAFLTAEEAKGSLQGGCSMGMYGFTIAFK